MFTEEFIRMMFTVDLYGNRGLDSRSDCIIFLSCLYTIVCNIFAEFWHRLQNTRLNAVYLQLISGKIALVLPCFFLKFNLLNNSCEWHNIIYESTLRTQVQDCLKVDMPILTCIFFTFNWLTLTSEMHFMKFHPEVASCLLSRGKRKYAPLGMRLLWKYINYFLVYQLISHFLSYLQNFKKFEAEILDLKLEKYGLSFDIKKCNYIRLSLGGWECDRHKVL